MLWSAGRATNGKIPISTPSNIQPKKAAASTSHWARVAPPASRVEAVVVIAGIAGNGSIARRHTKNLSPWQKPIAPAQNFSPAAVFNLQPP